MKKIIEVKNVSKKYTLGERQSYYSFRDTISGILKTPFRSQKLKKDEFWALKDISFDINEGDVVGIIGRNGAGKSTLLKILSQITPPSEGEIILRGRVASLLEVGTGFHPELTGRENIYLNGAILGMKRWEINKKYKEIIEFAEIEKFIDTPVKHYSSGMYMRLAFSVAAHLEPEILLVDEVLAVGDAQFQKKCLGKMSDVSKQGRTVLFVSHNMEAINKLCNKCILLENGCISNIGETEKIINIYSSNINATQGNISTENTVRRGNQGTIFENIYFEKENGEKTKEITSGDYVNLVCEYSSRNIKKDLKNIIFSVVFYNSTGERMFKCSTEVIYGEEINLPPKGRLFFQIPDIPLTPGIYRITPFLSVNGITEDDVIDGVYITVLPGHFYGENNIIPSAWNGKGVLIKHSFKNE